MVILITSKRVDENVPSQNSGSIRNHHSGLRGGKIPLHPDSLRVDHKLLVLHCSVVHVLLNDLWMSPNRVSAFLIDDQIHVLSSEDAYPVVFKT